jgi:hypothetical protein
MLWPGGQFENCDLNKVLFVSKFQTQKVEVGQNKIKNKVENIEILARALTVSAIYIAQICVMELHAKKFHLLLDELDDDELDELLLHMYRRQRCHIDKECVLFENIQMVTSYTHT